MTKRQIVDRWIHEVCEEGDMSVLDELLSPTLGADEQVISNLATRKEIPLLLDVLHTLIGKMRIEILVFLEDDDWAAVHYKMTSAGPDHARSVETDGGLMVRFVDGLIAEIVSQADIMTVFEHLGQLPPDAMLGCFSGQSLDWK